MIVVELVRDELEEVDQWLVVVGIGDYDEGIVGAGPTKA
jgi:hypothetical protein